MIKKLSFAFMALFVTLTASAQLKVYNDGKTSIGITTPYPNTLLSLGNNTSNSTSFGSIGLYTRLLDSINNTNNITGIFSHVNGLSSNNKKTIGIRSCAMSGTSGKMYGIIGSCYTLYDGIGVYATAGGYGASSGPVVTGSYAGYFAGPTYVSGTLTATEVVTPSDMTLKENIIPISEEETTTGYVLDNLMNMNVIKYNYKARVLPTDDDNEALYEDEEQAKAVHEISEQRTKEMAAQRHFGLSAQELQEIYPDLVRRSQDGILSINYVELVPILIRSIQELKAELDEVKGADGNAKKAPQTNAVANPNDNRVCLYQNIPNPFTAQTVIRYSLPDDAQNAYICIFDMTGKLLKKMPISSEFSSVNVNGYEFGEGIYLYSLVVNGQEIDTKRMILSK